MYFIRTDLLADIPDSFLEQALTDGLAGPITFEVLAERSSQKVDAVLVQRFEVPIAEGNPLYAVAREAAISFALKSLYTRRGYDEDRNPFAEDAATQAKKLTSIVNKKEPTGQQKKSAGSARAVTDKSNTHSALSAI